MLSSRGYVFGFLLLALVTITASAQELARADPGHQEIPLSKLAQQVPVAIEGRVISHRFDKSVPNSTLTILTVEIYKTFQGTLGGTTLEVVVPSALIQAPPVSATSAGTRLEENAVGLFFLIPSSKPATGKGARNAPVLWKLVNLEQGFIRYDERARVAYSTFRRYHNIRATLYQPLQTVAGHQWQEVKAYELTVSAP